MVSSPLQSTDTGRDKQFGLPPTVSALRASGGGGAHRWGLSEAEREGGHRRAARSVKLKREIVFSRDAVFQNGKYGSQIVCFMNVKSFLSTSGISSTVLCLSAAPACPLQVVWPDLNVSAGGAKAASSLTQRLGQRK